MSTGAEAAAAAIAEAIKASGAIVRVEPTNFKNLVWKTPEPLVVTAEGGLFKRNYQYLTSYKGLIFYTKSAAPLELGARVEVMRAKSIWIPR
jgi:hypothetical protein